MYQFETRDTCIEFVINNVPVQGNDVKLKLNLKLEQICKDCSHISFVKIMKTHQDFL